MKADSNPWSRLAASFHAARIEIPAWTAGRIHDLMPAWLLSLHLQNQLASAARTTLVAALEFIASVVLERNEWQREDDLVVRDAFQDQLAGRIHPVGAVGAAAGRTVTIAARIVNDRLMRAPAAPIMPTAKSRRATER
jgi:hypothetical protein